MNDQPWVQRQLALLDRASVSLREMCAVTKELTDAASTGVMPDGLNARVRTAVIEAGVVLSRYEAAI